MKFSLTAIVLLIGAVILRAGQGPTSRTDTPPGAKGDEPSAPKKDGEDALTKIRKGQLLTKEQMSRVRLAEFKPGERVTVRFKNDVLHRFLDAVAGSPEYSYRGYREEFLAKSNSEKLAEILEVTGMYFADDIEVTSDPEAIRVFRTDVMPMIRTGCASSKCHGGPNAPRIRLHTQETPAAVLTNFYVLDSFEGPGGVRMFDRGYPEEGYFTQYLLPRDLARAGLAHPGADIPPLARDRDDRRYMRAVTWIGQVLRRPRQDPGLHESPDRKGKTQPTVVERGSRRPATQRGSQTKE